MLRKTILLIVISIQISLYAINVIINEVMYDPVGTDDFHEWIELYNPRDIAVNLEGWVLLSGGEAFDTTFVFPRKMIQAHGFLLIGEEDVENADIIALLDLQNGGAESDGIRLISANGYYTDTVLYDSPNSNGLGDDESNPGWELLQDVVSGHSLARKSDGVDTNLASDWFDCSIPSPGKTNVLSIDLAIEKSFVKKNSPSPQLFTLISNLSTNLVDNSPISVDIYVDNSLFIHITVSQLMPLEVLTTVTDLPNLTEGCRRIRVILNYSQDSNPGNNSYEFQYWQGRSPLIINEIMYAPASDNQEWLEVYNRSDSTFSADSLFIEDTGGGRIEFSGMIHPFEYKIICSNPEQMKQKYIWLTDGQILPASSWTYLNNTDETLKLEIGTQLLDSVYYNGSGTQNNHSLERNNPYSEEGLNWSICNSEFTATPGQVNSNIIMQNDLEISFISFEVSGNQLIHKVFIKNTGLNNIRSFLLRLYQEEENLVLLDSVDIIIADSISYVFQTDLPEDTYCTFKYVADSAEDENQSNNFCISKYLSKTLPCVINEIMYNPLVDEPEWLEIRVNNPGLMIDDFYLVSGEETIVVKRTNKQFIVLTSTVEDSTFLAALIDHNLADLQRGLPALLNTGENLCFQDKWGNCWDSFFYQPSWSKEKGVSIERVNHNILPSDTNWGFCLNEKGNTIGTENSILIQTIVSNVGLTVNPDPFSPYRNERTMLTIRIPEKISKVNCRIFDLKGRIVKKISDQKLQPAEFSIIWDGKDDKGQNLLPGIYIIQMEACGNTTGRLYRKQKTVVIGK